MSTNTKLAEALRLGREGAPATEEERLLFEAWMRGHCWALCATWDGKQYVSDSEQGGYVDPRAMNTRQIFAAWRDRAALAAHDAEQAQQCTCDCRSDSACLLCAYRKQWGFDTAPTEQAAQAVPATEFCWLVELFDPNTDNSLGDYHTGFTDLAGESRSTKDPLKAQRYGTKEAASRAAFRLKFNKVGIWRAVEHGFMSAPTAPAPQAQAAPAPEAQAAAETFDEKCARNARVQSRYDELMREGKHGHYETMFRVVREEVERARAAMAQRQPLTEPPPGLLMSMAIRYDHALGCPGYYDSEFFKAQGVTHAQRLEGTLRTMRQLWEEVTGRGFYSPEREAEYAKLAGATTGEQHG